MKVFAQSGNSDLATVYLASDRQGRSLEFVESVQPPLPKERKWVILVSSLFGCPVKCRFCDAGTMYQGKPGPEEIMFQIDYLVQKYYPGRQIPVPKWKIQFARMGEPALNMAVISVLQLLPSRYSAPGLLPSLSTIAPAGCDEFFSKLLDVNKSIYQGRFQLQFSIHTTDKLSRDRLIPVKKWEFKQIAEYGEKFYINGGRKVTLNFVLGKEMILDQEVLRRYFDPKKFLVKLTPVNPTLTAINNAVLSSIGPRDYPAQTIESLENAGFDVIYSFGEWEENHIGSNCGQYLSRYLEEKQSIDDAYRYPVVYDDL